jgi:RNA polymerase sigma factor (sigma-70 family)
MAEAGLLREFLVARYDDLKRRLAQRLGSSDLAGDALQDTYVRLEGKEHLSDVHHPGPYLYRMAFRIAIDYMRKPEQRLAADVAEDEHLVEETVDTAPGPEQIVNGRADLARLLKLLDKLPARRREVLLAVQLDGTPQKELAERYGVSLRTIERDLELAHAYCLARMKRE